MTVVDTAAAPPVLVGSFAWALCRRLAVSLLILWGAVTAAFVVLKLGGGSTVNAIIGTAQVSPEVRAQIINDYKLDDPVVLQYLNYLWRLLHGDLGRSYALRMPVTDAIRSQIGPTLELVGVAAVLSMVLAVVLALVTANRSWWIRGTATSLEVLTAAVPGFWLGILLLTAFSFNLGWFPAVGASGAASLVLPAVALSAAPTALLSQVLRHGVERVLDEPFVVTVRSRGVSHSAVLLRHVLRHAAMPVVTLWGWIVGALISGAVVTEQVYSRPGLGRMAIAAVTGKDLPLVLGVVVITATFYTVINTSIDIGYRRLDPRLRTSTPRRARS